MPLHRQQPRPVQLRLRWLTAEIDRMLKQIRVYNITLATLAVIRRTYPHMNNDATLRQLAAVILQRDLVWQRLLQRRKHSNTAAKFRSSDSFGNEQFREMFRFRRREFMTILLLLDMLTPDGRPNLLRIGRQGHRSIVPSDFCLMVCLARLSYPLRYVDLAARLGGSRTICCDAFHFMIEKIDVTYGKVVMDIDRWLSVDNVLDCCDIMGAADDRLNHVLGFVDTTFQPCARPGGDGCVFENVYERDVYSGHKKSHGLKWQVLVFSNGLSCTTRESPGGFGDAVVLAESNWLPKLQAVSDNLGFDACVIGDGSYSRGPNLIRRNIREEQILSDEMSALLNRWRVLVENDFASIHNNWQYLCAKPKTVLATGPFARIWRTSMLFHNLQTLAYGNQVTARLGYHLKHLSFEDYLA